MRRYRITLLMTALILAALPLTAAGAARTSGTAPAVKEHAPVVSITGHASVIRPDDSTAELNTTSYLPAAGSGSQTCIDRSLTLDAGNYDWQVFIETAGSPERALYLAAGSYLWEACIVGYTGDYYLVESTLEVSGYSPAGYISTFDVSAPSLEYTWGSYLTLLS
jgi:hypothetical protein